MTCFFSHADNNVLPLRLGDKETSPPTRFEGGKAYYFNPRFESVLKVPFAALCHRLHFLVVSANKSSTLQTSVVTDGSIENKPCYGLQSAIDGAKSEPCYGLQSVVDDEFNER